MKTDVPKRKIFTDAVDLLSPGEQVATGSGVEILDIDSIKPFRHHPFHLYEGERLNDMVESIKEHGVLDLNFCPVFWQSIWSRQRKSFMQQNSINSTIQLNVSYDPKADCLRFKQFLEESMGGDMGQVKLIQEMLGYFLIPVNLAQKCFVIVGAGGAGKSKLLMVLNELLLQHLASQEDMDAF